MSLLFKQREFVSAQIPLGASKEITIRGRKCFMYERDWARFLSFVSVDENSGCWVWSGYRWGRNNRPAFGGLGMQKTATHVAYAWSVGPVPADRECCHTCDNDDCVNPEHLFLGTHKENMKDMWNKGRGFNVGAHNARNK